MQREAFNLAMLRALRSEINIRIAVHFGLLFTKYIVGTVILLTVVATNFPGNLAALGLLIAAILALLLDIVILENLGWVRAAGSFQKNHLENTELNILRWESKAAQPGEAWSCFTVPGYILGTWSVGPLLFGSAFFLQFDAAASINVIAVVATTYFMTYSLYLIFRHLGTRNEVPIPPAASPIEE